MDVLPSECWWRSRTLVSVKFNHISKVGGLPRPVLDTFFAERQAHLTEKITHVKISLTSDGCAENTSSQSLRNTIQMAC